ncbi:hypothetical protein PPL_07468 [Heterostelium album PN500]|uniref:Uncharacterized protein n=1 Tax=Heterostelium pallidum (strain ATCC 26659 / Pp 5 / PN500) TaxID=670386 RepID=D3BG17_HETP5|nr:hypothetical protein PPL_07468 [Heterostelium album PN500]EFA79609.1 hypothetical protein PPL_07468 [Heterostelium album PN500]|eukprot:XP_020431730.1 hypothetical protein PPL_07468 [Heterostelium album PN500]
MEISNSILGKRSYQETTSVEEEDLVQQPIKVEDIDFSDLNSLINFNRIYNLYYQCLESRNDSLRSKCVKFFVDYHEYKFIHYFDVQGYIKFIVDVFFDPEFKVFKNMSSFKCRVHIPTIEHIYNRIFIDKRDCYNKLLAKNIDNKNTVKHQINQNDEIQLEKKKKSNNYVNQESKCILSAQLLERIITFSIIELPTFNINQNDIEIVLNIALVSKQFFKMVSKYNPNGYYLRGPINLQSEHCIVQSPPLEFDYESIKYIKYGESTDRINQLFSSVEKFHITSDEKESNINDGIKREYLDNPFTKSKEHQFYREAIESDGYLPHLPAMPNLKSITLSEYYGFGSNYNSFLTSIFTNTPNGDGHGIERFKIDINKDWNCNPDYVDLDFLETLLLLHSNTLKSIEIKYLYRCHAEDMKELLRALKDFIPTLERQQQQQHSFPFKFKLYANYSLLQAFCEDDQDRKVYQYLLNQKVKNNIPDEDYDDIEEYCEDNDHNVDDDDDDDDDDSSDY